MKKFIKGLCNFLLIPLLFGFVSLLLISYGIEASFSYKNIKKTIKETVNNSISQKTLTENNIFSSIYKQSEEYGMTKEDVDELLKNTRFQDILSEYSYSVMYEKDMKLSEDEINEIQEQIVNIAEKNGNGLTDSQKEDIKSYIEQTYQNANKVNIKTENDIIKTQASMNSIMEPLTSKKLRIVAILIMVLICISLILINNKNLMWVKIITDTTFSSSFFLWIGCVLIIPLVKKLANPDIAFIIKSGISPVTKISFVTALVCLVIRIIYGLLINKRERKKELSNA